MGKVIYFSVYGLCLVVGCLCIWRVSALLEVERNLSGKIQELLKKIDQLEADLTSLHETLEKIESELTKVKSEKEELSFRNKNQTDIITTLQSKKWQGKEVAYGKTAKKQP
jgi:chromosome segregation ATPase